MITVAVFINDKLIIQRSAVNVTANEALVDERGIATYRLDDGTLLKHERALGAEPLVIQMLENNRQNRKREALALMFGDGKQDGKS